MKIYSPKWNPQTNTYRFIFSQGGITAIDEAATLSFLEKVTESGITIPGVELVAEPAAENLDQWLLLKCTKPEDVVGFFKNTGIQTLLLNKQCGFTGENIKSLFADLDRSLPLRDAQSAATLAQTSQFARTPTLPAASPPAPTVANRSKTCG